MSCICVASCARVAAISILGERDLNAALPLIDQMHVVASGTYLALGADIARVRGEWSLERQFFARAHERARNSALPNFMAFDTAESLIAAWFAGDRPAFNAIAAELERAVVRGGVAGFAYLAASRAGTACNRARPTSRNSWCLAI